MASLILDANLSNISTIHNFVDEVGREHHLDVQTLHALHIVMGEACTNVIVHAYKSQGGPLQIHVEVQDNCIWILIRDWGLAFDPSQVPVPDVTATLENRPLGGLGVYLIRQMMDDVIYDFDAELGNTLTMIKRTGKASDLAETESPAGVA